METNNNEYTEDKSIYQPTLFELVPDLEFETIEIGEPDEKYLITPENDIEF